MNIAQCIHNREDHSLQDLLTVLVMEQLKRWLRSRWSALDISFVKLKTEPRLHVRASQAFHCQVQLN